MLALEKVVKSTMVANIMITSKVRRFLLYLFIASPLFIIYNFFSKKEKAFSSTDASTDAITIVPTVKHLKNYPVSDNTAVQILGYYEPGDGGGGLFYWDGLDTTSFPNEGTIFLSSNQTDGRWKRIYSGAINVLWFGVKNNDTNPIDNTKRLQGALDYAGTNRYGLGHIVFFPPGTYAINSTLQIKQEGIHLDGVSGRARSDSPFTGSVIKCVNVPFGQPAILIQGNRNQVTNLSIRGNELNHGNKGKYSEEAYTENQNPNICDGIQIKDTSEITLRNLYLEDIRYGINYDFCWNIITEKVTVRGSYIAFNGATKGNTSLNVGGLSTASTLTSCLAYNAFIGFQIEGVYKTLSACGCDTIRAGGIGLLIRNATGLVVTSFGMENALSRGNPPSVTTTYIKVDDYETDQDGNPKNSHGQVTLLSPRFFSMIGKPHIGIHAKRAKCVTIVGLGHPFNYPKGNKGALIRNDLENKSGLQIIGGWIQKNSDLKGNQNVGNYPTNITITTQEISLPKIN